MVHRIDPLDHSSKRGRAKPRSGRQTKIKRLAVIRSSLRKAPILDEVRSKAKKGARLKTSRRSTLVSHARISSTIYPPRDAMRQRILRKIAVEKARRELEPGCQEEAKEEVAKQSFTTQRCHERKAENQVLMTCTRAPTNVAREEFKKAVLAQAAMAREKNSKGNGQGETARRVKRVVRNGGNSAKGCGHGLGYDHRQVATSSLPERDAILRLLAS